MARGIQGTFKSVGVYDFLWFICLQINITYKLKHCYDLAIIVGGGVKINITKRAKIN